MKFSPRMRCAIAPILGSVPPARRRGASIVRFTNGHRLIGYNNDPATHLEDVRSLFAEALARSK